jgi:fucose permease
VRRPTPLLIVLAFAAFVSLGLPDTVLGVAWPFVRDRFGLAQSASALPLWFGVSGYFLSGLLAGRLVRTLGLGGLLAASSALVALGLAGYALAPSWWVFFPMAAIIGLGSGAIDAGLNGYAAHHFPVGWLNWLHACWGVGATVGPIIMTAVLVGGAAYRSGYAILAVALGSMAIAFGGTRKSWDDPGEPALAGGLDGGPAPGPEAVVAANREDAGAWAALRGGRVWLQIAIFFAYTGVETGTGFWCFTVLREGRGLSVEAAGAWTTAFWGALLAGRVLLGLVIDAFGPDRLLRTVTYSALAGVAAYAALPGLAGRSGLLVIGASLAPIFPTLIARTPARLGAATAAHAVGFQVSAATLGAAVFPSLYGLLAQRAGANAIPPALVGAMLVLLGLHEVLLRLPDLEPRRPG